jgi:hypothetical protein
MRCDAVLMYLKSAIVLEEHNVSIFIEKEKLKHGKSGTDIQ